MRYILALCIVLLCGACQNSPDINTPRDTMTKDGIRLAHMLSIAIQYDNTEQEMRVVENLFRCEMHESGTELTVLLRMEAQNIAPLSGPYLNSVYFRAAALPVDGILHSISGDPTQPGPNAAKLLFFDNTLLPLIPSLTTGLDDNFRVGMYKMSDSRMLHGWFAYRTVVVPTSRPINITGQFTLGY